MKNNWQKVKIKDLLEYERPDRYIVGSTNYIDQGCPVLTANKSFILGYTNETDGVYRNIPAIIFDDFTTDCKFVDFPFKVKSSAIKILKEKSIDVDLRFVFELMKSIKFPVGNHKRYYISQYQNTEVLVPSLYIQKKISTILSTIDNAIAKTDQIIQKTEELKKGLMNELFVKGLGSTSFKSTVYGKIPSYWELKKVIEVAEVVDSLHQTPKYSESGFPMVRVMDIKSGDLNLTNCVRVSEVVYKQFTKNHIPAKGDLVISRVGSFGIFSYVNTTDNFCLGQNTAVISPQIDSLFLYYVLQSPMVTNQVNKLVVGSNQKTLSLGYIRNLYMPIPPEKEQKQIAQILTSIDQKLSKEKSYKDRLLVLKNGLMNDIFRRKVEVN